MTAPTWRRLVVGASLAVGLCAAAPAAVALSATESGTAAGCDHAAHVQLSPAHFACLSSLSGFSTLASSSDDPDKDIMQLTDEPGNWFRSERTGTPVTTLPVGGEVQFVAGHLTNTRHTATLVARPPGSQLDIDQDDSKTGGIANAKFDAPGLYLFLCKVHPYMTGVVLVADAAGNVPDVTAEQFPFIGFLGVRSLPVSAVLAAVATIAPTDAEKAEKWYIGSIADEIRPVVPGVGEVWIDTQFEFVPGQTDDRMVPKPGTITVVNADVTNGVPFTIEKEVSGLDPEARFRWNNPHNMWASTDLGIVYNGHWFGRWHNKIDRKNADVLTTIEVGHAPTHTVSNPNERSEHFEHLTLPQSALNVAFELFDEFAREPSEFSALQKIIANYPTGFGLNHPHAQWLSSDGRYGVFPNVFKDEGIFVGAPTALFPTPASSPGLAGGLGVVDLERHEVAAEFLDPQSVRAPVATGIQGVTAGNKAYVANIVSGQVSVIDLNTLRHIKDIPVTLTPTGLSGPQFDVFSTLQVPIQLPVSPDGRFVAVAVLSLSTVPPRPQTGSVDHIALIDTQLDEVVRFVGVPPLAGGVVKAAGIHGANFGAKLGGGYYGYIANQFSNMLFVLDPDPNGDGIGLDAAVVGRILLANGTPGGPRVTDGVGGQGIKPLPNVYDGWIQDTVAVAGRADPEVQGWLAELTRCQRDPSAAGCRPAGPGR
jgi:YVTN family beta-propeller protein